MEADQPVPLPGTLAAAGCIPAGHASGFDSGRPTWSIVLRINRDKDLLPKKLRRDAHVACRPDSVLVSDSSEYDRLPHVPRECFCR